MTKPTTWSRLLYGAGAAAVILALGYQVVRARLPGPALAVEALLFGCGAVYSVVAIRREAELLAAPPWVGSAMTVANISLATAILVVAAPYLPDAVPLSFAVLLTTILATVLSGESEAEGGPRPRPLLVTMVLLVAISLIWLRAGVNGRPAPANQLLTWAGLLGGIGVLLDVHWRHGRLQLDVRMQRLEMLSAVAQQLGSATELDDVAATVLEAFRRTYPSLGWGGILMWNPQSRLLEALPATLSPGGVVHVPSNPGSTGLGIKPGEGLAGEAFEAGQIAYRSTAAEASRDSASRRDETNEEIGKLVGVVRSAIAAPLRDGGGEVIGVVSLGSSTSERSWSEPDLRLIEAIANQAGVAMERGLLYESQKRQASTDPLTGLPNRRDFERGLATVAPDAPFSVLAIDLDNLKLINDEYGHEAGDAVLRMTARALRSGLRNEDYLARVGGDEFAAILPATGRDMAGEVAERLTRSMQGVSVPYGTAQVSAGCATGVPGEDPHSVWNDADVALYRAKTRGRNRVEAIAAPPTPPVRQARRWADTLPVVLARREMGAAYQPVVSFEDGSVIGYESLARPLVEDHGPGVEGLFSSANRMGLGRDLDWLCRRAAIQHAHALPGGRLLFLNVGVAALLDPLHDVDQMLLLLRWGGRDPNSVVLEITEREAVHDLERFREVLAIYRENGFRFAMDDVGEGHSTLEILAAGSPEFIKIAQSLTRTAMAPGPNAAIRAVSTFADFAGALVIAEGIESARDAEIMSGLGVTLGQGYHLGRPARAENALLAVRRDAISQPA